MVPDDGQLDERNAGLLFGFESLLADLSARFINLPSDQLDVAIEDVQRRICEHLGLDLSVLWQWGTASPGVFEMTHYYRRLNGPPIDKKMEASVCFPWSLREVKAGRFYVISSMEDVPEGAERDAETWRQLGLKNIATFPLSAGGGAPIGVVSFHDMGKERRWTEAMVGRLQLVAQVFANAIVRKRTDAALLENQSRLSLATESAGVGLWVLNAEQQHFWVSPKAMALLGLPPGDVLDIERFFALVHPEDRKHVRESMVRASALPELSVLEYRIFHTDGSIRWMLSRGRPCASTEGKAPRLMGVTVDVTERKELESQLLQSLVEVRRLKDQLQTENLYLREQLHRDDDNDAIVGESESLLKMLGLAKRVAPTDSTVLITGETGTGKELLAQAIHGTSRRKGKPMIKVNCAALPAPLVESELFGREKGAYTGAMTQQMGRFEMAHGSTLFLDEIGDLPLDLQSKLLRVLQDGRFERLGGTRTLTVDVRLITATNRDLSAMVREGKFREDLFHRLNVFPIEAPSLRSRRDDIPALIWSFVQEFNKKMGKAIDTIPKPVMEQLKQYSWPGNIRELRNLIERAVIVSDSRSLKIEMPDFGLDTKSAPVTLQEMERKYIRDVLERVQWRIRGKNGAAEILGVLPTTLHSKMKKLGLFRSPRD